MRGKDQRSPLRFLPSRITPAYAGKSSEIILFVNWKTGSPPPMRGKASKNGRGQMIERITPAYAGKSSGEMLVLLSYEDHPRLCGEKSFFSRQTIFPAGSPPPMRGKEFRPSEDVFTTRITPAYAGKSYWVTVSQQQTEDHPRLCGEKKTA